MPKKIKQAFILSAGLGTRLRPLTNVMPKVMVPIADGKPLLEHTIELLRDQGIDEFIINLHYLPEAITSYFKDGKRLGVKISYSDETQRLMDTGGAIKKMEKMLHDNFIFMYGDELHFFDFQQVIDLHLRNNALATIVLKTSELPQNGDLAEFDVGTKRIKKWHARPHSITAYRDNLANNAGLYVMSKKIANYIPADAPVKLDGAVIPKAMLAGEKFYAYPTTEPILDIGDLGRYQAAKEFYRRRTV
jgi:NDP-sugar pyrophosphorylase family protein